MYLLVYTRSGQSYPIRPSSDPESEAEKITRDGVWTNFPRDYRVFVPAREITQVQLVDEELDER